MQLAPNTFRTVARAQQHVKDVYLGGTVHITVPPRLIAADNATLWGYWFLPDGLSKVKLVS